ncbi:hypothetical protein RHORCCE3_1930 [Rickettsia hoogstraalii str. RCCE3]|nr:hypothetical protein RHORCCE3_2468 [Rickettsia hoogstraalii str. RCCE3]KJV78083.1 hypothetical protein RHORCCE3_1930 [Rickettsia hoogstraalii str. RCCE3]
MQYINQASEIGKVIKTEIKNCSEIKLNQGIRV